ncbi:hypothetical protein [Rhodopirellula sp. MGV]|uniref:hypothetical protein n=1 Tax=Rhodopirellula sp. MGV TaxID=2023130 RepID=UPI000B95E420|nr:hypothetical protein [Rhodopirellula sp. MGV]PNY38317.1 hypothetical protein C2E31_03110 [Rhodopirellula baltica]
MIQAVGFALIAAFATEGDLWAQGGNSLDVPQTRLTPLGTALPGGQTYQGGQNYQTPPDFTNQGYNNQGFGTGNLGAPTLGGMQTNPNAAGNLGSPLGYPTTPSGTFDPYAGGPAGGYIAPSPYAGAPQTYGANPTFGGLGSSPVLTNPFGGSPVAIPSSGYAGPLFNGGGYGSTGYNGTIMDPAMTAPGYAGSPYPSATPSTLFPGGIMQRPGSLLPPVDPFRLIQRVRMRHTFLADPGDHSDINTTDIAFAFAFPRFFWSNQPLFVAPSFSWHQPHEYDLYDAFVDLAWQSDPNQIAGVELQFGVGVFSEFGVYDTDSLRLRGRGLGVFRLSPATTFKVGVHYLDRQRVKVLPAGGLFWQPNPFTKIDLYFPQPRLSKFLATLGTQDVWWYLTGEYGEGSWTRNVLNVERQADINDIRAIFGLELGRSDLIRAGRRTWFAEVGYVFDREIFVNEQLHQDLDSTWMVRLGVGY